MHFCFVEGEWLIRSWGEKKTYNTLELCYEFRMTFTESPNFIGDLNFFFFWLYMASLMLKGKWEFSFSLPQGVAVREFCENLWLERSGKASTRSEILYEIVFPLALSVC